jgi:hypothetical protein
MISKKTANYKIISGRFCGINQVQESYSKQLIFYITFEQAQQAGVLHYTRQEKLDRGKQSGF